MNEVERITDLNEIYFPNLGWRFHIDPTAFTVFGLDIQWYGLIITFGLLMAMLYCFPKMRRFGLVADKVFDPVIGGVIGGVLGARIYYVASKWDEYAGDWKSIINFRNGGLAIYGGIIGALAVGLLICKLRKIRILPTLDIACIGFLIGQGIGRWGNFTNQEAFGTNTDSLFAMTGGTIQQTILRESAFLDGSMYQSGIEISEKYAVHPCFLYESIWCLLGVLVLSLFIKHRKFDGQLFLMYLVWYGAERFVVEGLRTDSLMAGNIRISQALSAVLVITGTILLIVMFSKVRRDPEKYVLYCNTEESKQQLAEADEQMTRSKSTNNGSENTADKSSDEDQTENKTNINQEESENGTDN